MNTETTPGSSTLEGQMHWVLVIGRVLISKTPDNVRTTYEFHMISELFPCQDIRTKPPFSRTMRSCAWVGLGFPNVMERDFLRVTDKPQRARELPESF